jgi:hypothetical protein
MKHIHTYIKSVILAGIMLGASLAVYNSMPQHASAACSSLPSAGGTATFTINVPAATTYRLWTHVFTPSTSNNGVYVRVDQSYCQLTVGDASSQATNQFAWVDYQNGSTSNKVNLNLSAGDHTVTFAGMEDGVGVDKILLLADTTCTPTGDGANCTNTSGSTSSTTPTTSGTITLPSAPEGSTRSYTLNGQKVDGNTIDTTKLKDGVYTLEITQKNPDGTTRVEHQQIVVANHKTFKQRLVGTLKSPFLLVPLGLLLVLSGMGMAIWLRRPELLRGVTAKVMARFGRHPALGTHVPTPTNGSVVFVSGHGQPAWHKTWGVAAGMAVGVIGLGLVIFALAATNFASYIVSGASLTSGATLVSRADAISGKMVRFSASTVTPSPPPPSPTPTPTPTPSPPSGSCPTSGTNVPGGPDGSGGCWPNAANTGIPAGTALTAYSGPCTITTAGTIIDAKTINCDLIIQAANVQVKRSKINGSIATDENSTGYSFTISDSEVDIGNRAGTGVGAVNFTATRVHVYGGNRSMHCWNSCTITDSYVHAQFTDPSGTFHESGIRMGQSATFRHNTILCDAPDVPPDGGCSADLTGYGDFGPVQNNTIDHNLLAATTGGFCAYGGSSQGKPYSSQTNHIVYTNNVFKRGTNKSDKGTFICGYYGAITDFDTAAPGNVWTNNKFDDGATLLP